MKHPIQKAISLYTIGGWAVIYLKQEKETVVNIIPFNPKRKHTEPTKPKDKVTKVPFFERIYMKDGELLCDTGTYKGIPFSWFQTSNKEKRS